MKRNSINILGLALVSVVAFSCSNKELESRIAKLEGKVAEMETSSSPISKANTPAKPVAEVKPEGPLPMVAFNEESHDFGTINEGEVVEHIFKFKNTGEAPLIISSATATCGCTVPVWPKEPIPVGEEGEIQVRFNSKGKPGIQNKTVTVTANTFPKQNKVKIKANVTKKDNPA